MKKRAGIVVGVGAVVFILLAAIGFCEEPTAEKVLKSAKSARDEVNDMSANISVEVKLNGKKITKKGTVQYRDDKKFRIESVVTFPGDRAPINVLTVSDGKTLWKVVRNAKGDVRDISKVDLARIDEIVPALVKPGMGTTPDLEALARHFALTCTGTETVLGDDTYVLAGKPDAAKIKDADALKKVVPESVKFYISTVHGFPLKIEHLHESGRKVTVVFEKVKINTGLRESLFSFIPPRGAPVFYATDIVEAMIETLEDVGDEKTNE
jgi:outer membrane lipoprotein-sorting protein